jgi:Zn-finger nucleic acid-binding protein
MGAAFQRTLDPTVPVQSTPLHCLYCGQTASVDRPVCPTCGATAHYVRCPACGRSAPAADDTCACGAPLHPGLSPAAPVCPRCPSGALVPRTLGPPAALDAAASGSAYRSAPAGACCALQCDRCHGCFLRVRDWSLVVEQVAHGHPIETQDLVVPTGDRLDPSRLAETALCPACRKPMDRFRFALRSEALVDVCQDHGMWLDAGELARALEAARAVLEAGHLPAPSEQEQRDELQFEAELAREEMASRARIAHLDLVLRATDSRYAMRAWWRTLADFLRDILR